MLTDPLKLKPSTEEGRAAACSRTPRSCASPRLHMSRSDLRQGTPPPNRFVGDMRGGHAAPRTPPHQTSAPSLQVRQPSPTVPLRSQTMAATDLPELCTGPRSPRMETKAEQAVWRARRCSLRQHRRSDRHGKPSITDCAVSREFLRRLCADNGHILRLHSEVRRICHCLEQLCGCTFGITKHE